MDAYFFHGKAGLEVFRPQVASAMLDDRFSAQGEKPLPLTDARR
jgi:hypothetical protein